MVSYRRGFALMAERKVGRQPDPPRPLDPLPEHHDIFLATIAGLLAWIITLALKTAFSVV
jgi:hypothetical protein